MSRWYKIGLIIAITGLCGLVVVTAQPRESRSPQLQANANTDVYVSPQRVQPQWGPKGWLLSDQLRQLRGPRGARQEPVSSFEEKQTVGGGDNNPNRNSVPQQSARPYHREEPSRYEMPLYQQDGQNTQSPQIDNSVNAPEPEKRSVGHDPIGGDYERDLELEIARLTALRMNKLASMAKNGGSSMDSRMGPMIAPMSNNIAIYHNTRYRDPLIRSAGRGAEDIDEDYDDRFITNASGKLRPRFVDPIKLGYQDDDDYDVEDDDDGDYHGAADIDSLDYITDTDRDRDYYQQQQPQQDIDNASGWFAQGGTNRKSGNTAMSGAPTAMNSQRVPQSFGWSNNNPYVSPYGKPSAGAPLRRSKRSLADSSDNYIDKDRYMMDESMIHGSIGPYHLERLDRFRRSPVDPLESYKYADKFKMDDDMINAPAGPYDFRLHNRFKRSLWNASDDYIDKYSYRMHQDEVSGAPGAYHLEGSDRFKRSLVDPLESYKDADKFKIDDDMINAPAGPYDFRLHSRFKRSLAGLSDNYVDKYSYMMHDDEISGEPGPYHLERSDRFKRSVLDPEDTIQGDSTPVSTVLRRIKRCGGGFDDDDGDANSVRRGWRRGGGRRANKSLRKVVKTTTKKKNKKNKKKSREANQGKTVKKIVTTKVIKNGQVKSVQTSEQPVVSTSATTVTGSTNCQDQPAGIPVVAASGPAQVVAPQPVPVAIPGQQIYVQTTPGKEVHTSSQTTQMSVGQPLAPAPAPAPAVQLQAPEVPQQQATTTTTSSTSSSQVGPSTQTAVST